MNTEQNGGSFDWKVLVSYILIFLNISISLGKQYLNNNKHVNFEEKICKILQKEKNETKKDDVITLNLPENLKASQTHEDKD